jgi:hypothetical protein
MDYHIILKQNCKSTVTFALFNYPRTGIHQLTNQQYFTERLHYFPFKPEEKNC